MLHHQPAPREPPQVLADALDAQPLGRRQHGLAPDLVRHEDAKSREEPALWLSQSAERGFQRQRQRASGVVRRQAQAAAFIRLERVR